MMILAKTLCVVRVDHQQEEQTSTFVVKRECRLAVPLLLNRPPGECASAERIALIIGVQRQRVHGGGFSFG